MKPGHRMGPEGMRGQGPKGCPLKDGGPVPAQGFSYPVPEGGSRKRNWGDDTGSRASRTRSRRMDPPGPSVQPLLFRNVSLADKQKVSL